MYNVKEKKRKPEVPPKPKWVDPFTPLQRWFFRLPCNSLARECHCGSGKPTIYWSPEDGTGCVDCAKDTFLLGDACSATIWNFMEKFDLSREVRDEIWTKFNKMQEEK